MVISVVRPAISRKRTPVFGVGLIVAANRRATVSATGCRDSIDTNLLNALSAPDQYPSAERRPLIDSSRPCARRPPHPCDPVGVLLGDEVAHHSHRDLH